VNTTDESIRSPGQVLDNEDHEALIMHILPDIMNEDLVSVAKAAGMQAALDIMLALGGSTIYVPCIEDLQRRMRDERIRREYARGAKVRVISRKYGLTERTVYKVLRKRPAKGP